MQNLLNNDNLINIGVAVVIVVIFVFIVMPYAKKAMGKNNVTEETFESEEMPVDNEEMPVPTEEVPVSAEEAPQGPYVDSKTGSLIDGPGFEKGEVEDAYQESPNGIPSNYYFLDDGADGEMSIQHNLCSPSCCSEQWPTPFKRKYDPYVCQNKDKFVPSNIFCNNTFQDSGCLCLSKKQASFLYNRGGNGREWF